MSQLGYEVRPGAQRSIEVIVDGQVVGSVERADDVYVAHEANGRRIGTFGLASTATAEVAAAHFKKAEAHS